MDQAMGGSGTPQQDLGHQSIHDVAVSLGISRHRSIFLGRLTVAPIV